MVSVRETPLSLRVVAVALALAVAGCGSTRDRPLFPSPPATETAGVAKTHGIFVATTRHKADDPRAVFDGRRAPLETFARISVSVPAAHKPGALEKPPGDRADPAKYLTARSIEAYDGLGSFAGSVTAASRLDGGRALVFVHGYNTDFDDAVYRTTQIVHDAGYTGAPILFSWASGGRTVDYVYDRDSANAARDGLENLLRSLAKTGVKRIDVVAHSMGTWLTMEALRGLAISGDRDVGGRLGDVVLASPDIDVDVFKSQMRRYGVPDRPFFVLLSDDDKALRFSSLIAGQQPRLGEYRNAKEIAELGLIVVDLTQVKAGDSYNHTKFADNPALVSLLGEKLRQGDSLTADVDPDEAPGALANGVGAAAQIIVTTPFKVINMVVGG
jgi:esterase/lipase superfamily enzyme